METIEVTPQLNAFAPDTWSDTPPEPQATPVPEQPNGSAEPIATPEPTPTPTAPETTQEFNFKNWLTETIGVDDPDKAKEEITTLKKLKESAPKDPEFANDSSKTLYEYLLAGKEDEAFEVLSNKKRLDRILSSEITDKTAEEIIKLNIQTKHKDLTPEEVEFMYNENYSIPSKPVQSDSELDEDYAARVESWEGLVKSKKMKLAIDAKMAKPELEKLKADLVLPKINGVSVPEQVDPNAEAARMEELRQLNEKYQAAINAELPNFNGYEVTYKDGEVEIPVKFVSTEEQKQALKQRLETFDPQEFIMKRWFDENGMPKVKELMRDIDLLEQKENVLQKLVNETGNKVKEHIYKIKANVDVSGGSQPASMSEAANYSVNGQKDVNISQQVDFLWKTK